MKCLGELAVEVLMTAKAEQDLSTSYDQDAKGIEEKTRESYRTVLATD